MGPAGEPAARERGRATGIGVDGALITGEGYEVGGFCARPSIQKAKVSNVGGQSSSSCGRATESGNEGEVASWGGED